MVDTQSPPNPALREGRGTTKAGSMMLEWLAKEGYQGVCTHDGIMAEIGYKLWPDVPHPMNRAKRTGQHLRRDVRFKNQRIQAYNIKGHNCVLAYYLADSEILEALREADDAEA